MKARKIAVVQLLLFWCIQTRRHSTEMHVVSCNLSRCMQTQARTFAVVAEATTRDADCTERRSVALVIRITITSSSNPAVLRTWFYRFTHASTTATEHVVVKLCYPSDRFSTVSVFSSVYSTPRTKLLYSTVAPMKPISCTMSAVVWLVVSFAGAFKRDQTNDGIGYTTDRQRPWNKCVKLLSIVNVRLTPDRSLT